jgi:nicotinate phosphoribosyltransferase
VFRQREHGMFVGDTLARADEQLPGERMLVQVMAGGRRLAQLDLGLDAARARAAAQLAALHPGVRSLDAPIASYPVRVSERVTGELASLREALRA